MAAARRSSDSGLLAGMIVFFVLALIGSGCAIWFYQQLQEHEKAIQTTQKAFHDTIATRFTKSGWPLTTQSPPELGVRYAGESYGQVLQKLDEADEYEKEFLPTLGWQSLDGMRSAMAESPIQQEAEAQGVGPYAQLSELLVRYEDLYVSLSAEVQAIRGDNEDLAGRLATAQRDLTDTKARLEQDLTRATEQFNTELAALSAANEDLQNRHERQRQDAADWRQKHQQEADERRGEVAKLEGEVARWRKMYEDEVAGPGERERLIAKGEVIEVSSDYDFVIIQGGRDRDVQENDRFIVYSLAPDGKGQKKGVILVGRVHDTTSLATIAEEEKYIVQGDYFVSLERWNQFHRRIAEAGGGQ